MLLDSNKQHLLTEYFNQGVRAVYKKGEIIIRPHETPDHIYYVESGFVKAYSITKYGEENIHLIRHDGEVFPLIWTFTEEHRDVTYEAIDECVIWSQSKNAYLTYLEHSQDATTAVLALTVRAYHTYAEHVNTLEYRTVRERLISFLLACCRRFGEQRPDGSVRILAPLRQQDVAGSINATRESAGRELSGLNKKGLIRIDDRYISVTSPSALKDLL